MYFQEQSLLRIWRIQGTRRRAHIGAKETPTPFLPMNGRTDQVSNSPFTVEVKRGERKKFRDFNSLHRMSVEWKTSNLRIIFLAPSKIRCFFAARRRQLLDTGLSGSTGKCHYFFFNAKSKEQLVLPKHISYFTDKKPDKNFYL